MNTDKCPTCGAPAKMTWSGLDLVAESGDETLASKHYEYQPNGQLPGIGSKRPTTQGIRSVGTRYMNKSKWGNLIPLDIREAFISGAEWALSQAACDTAKGRSAEETAPAPKAD